MRFWWYLVHSQFCEQILSIWFPLSLLKRKPCIYWAVSTNSPFPMALETTNPFFAAMVCLFQVFHINGILLSVTFNARFLSFCIFSRLIHVVAWNSTSFYDWVNILLHGYPYPHFVCPFICWWIFRVSLPFDQYCSCEQHVQVLIWIPVSSFFEYIP